MKKSIVAGAASLVLAAMPVIGVFAANPAAVVDTLTVTVNESCTFEHDTGNSGSFTKSMAAGALDTAFGESVFKSACNNGLGYDINAVFTSLAHTAGNGTAIAYSATTPTAGSGTWTATVSGSNIATTQGKLGTKGTQDPASGTSYTVNYTVSTHDDQASGTYTGTATYTLVQKTGA